MSMGTWSANLVRFGGEMPRVSIRDPQGERVACLSPWYREGEILYERPEGFTSLWFEYDRDFVAEFHLLKENVFRPTEPSWTNTYFLGRDGTILGIDFDVVTLKIRARPLGEHGKFAFWIDLAIEAGLELPGMENRT
jgi:hypothetical protein